MKQPPANLNRFCYFLIVCFAIGLVTTALWAQEQVESKQSATSNQEVEAKRPAESNSETFHEILLTQSDQSSEQSPAVKQAILWLARNQSQLEAGDSKAVLGVHVRSTDETLRNQLSLSRGVGLVVEHVTPDSAASDAKLQLHDVLIRFDNQILFNEEQLRGLIEMHKSGDEIELSVIRLGTTSSISATLRQGTSYAGASDIELLLHHGSDQALSFNHKMLSTTARCIDCHVVDGDTSR